MRDIVYPKENEKEFKVMAQKLGIDELMFVYTNKKDFKENQKNAFLVEPKNVQKAKSSKAVAICKASREAIERGADIVYGFELEEKKDKTHYRRSGLNQVLCKLAERKKVAIGFSFSEILSSKKKAVLLGRITQNIKFCTKYKVKMKIASFAKTPYEMRAPEDLGALFQELGMHASQAKKALE